MKYNRSVDRIYESISGSGYHPETLLKNVRPSFIKIMFSLKDPSPIFFSILNVEDLF